MIKVLDIRENASIGGINSQLIYLYQGRNNNQEIQINYAFLGFEPKGWLINRAEQLGIKLSWIPYYGPLDFMVIGRLNEFIQKQEFDVIHTQGFRGNCLIRILKLVNHKNKFKTIITKHGVAGEKSIKLNLYLWLDKLATKLADKIIAVDEQTYFRMIDWGVKSSKLSIIENPIPILRNVSQDEISILRRELRIPQEKKILLFLGRIVKDKGIYEMVEAHKLVSRKIDLLSIFVGEGSELPNIKKYVANIGFDKQIFFLGGKNDIALYLGLCDCLVLPSYAEGLPNVILEAISAKKPIIASRVGGIPRYVQNGINGYLVEPRNIQDLAQKIFFLFHDPAAHREMGKKGILLVKDLSSKVIYAKYLSIYKEVMNK